MTRTNLLKFSAVLALAFSFFASAPEVQAQPNKKQVERARKLAKDGDQLYNRKNYRGAIDKYAEAVTLVPTFPAAYFWKGWSHYFLNEFDQAIADLTTAEEQRFEKPLEIYKLRWWLYYQAKNYDAALRDVVEAAKLDPNKVDFQIGAGDIYMSRKEWSNAVPYYQRAMEIDKSTSEVPYQLAVAYHNLGDFDNQFTAATEALRRKTSHVGEASFYIADTLAHQRKFDESIEFYQRAMDVKPDIYEVYGALSDIYRGRNEFDKAIEVARRGLAQFPKDATLYTSLAWYYSLADRPKEAIIAAKSAITVQPDLAMAYTNLCRAHNDAAEYQNAVVACQNALRLNPGDGETYLYMARAYEFLKQSERSIDAYKKAVDGLVKFTAANPEYSDGFYLLGNAYFAINKDADAIAAYNRCLSLAPRFAKARYSLGFTYLINGDKAKARDQYNLLKNIDPTLAEKLRAAIDK